MMTMITKNKPLRFSLSLVLVLGFSLFTAMTTASAPGLSHAEGAGIRKPDNIALYQIENAILSSVADHP